MVTEHIAWATTAATMPGADPGIGIQTQDRDPETGHVDPGDVIIDTAEADSWALTDDGGFDAATADATLAALGWERTGPWQRSGSAYAAPVASAA